MSFLHEKNDRKSKKMTQGKGVANLSETVTKNSSQHPSDDIVETTAEHVHATTKSLPNSDNKDSFTHREYAVLASCIAVAGAYIGPVALAWPVRNIVNTCFVISISRLLQLPNLMSVLLAVGVTTGLTTYAMILGAGK